MKSGPVVKANRSLKRRGAFINKGKDRVAMQADDEAGAGKAGKEGKRSSGGNGSSKGGVRSAKSENPVGFDQNKVIEALIRERELTLPESEEVVKEVKAEIKSQKIPDLPDELLKELIDSKVQELRLRWGVAEESNEDGQFF